MKILFPLFCGYFSLRITATASAASVRRNGDNRRVDSAELRGRERNVSEGGAGIVLARCMALFIGQAILACRHKKLGVTHQADHGEKAKRNGEITSVSIIVNKIPIHLRGDLPGDITAATAAVTIRGSIQNPCTKHNGIQHLNNRLGILLCAANKLRCTAIATLGAAEYVYVALAAIQDNALLYDRDTLELLRRSHRHTNLKGSIHVKFNVNCIKAAVELDRLRCNASTADACLFYTHTSRSADKILACSGQIYANVLKAISVAARIQNSSGLDAHGLPAGTAVTKTGKLIICHRKYFLLMRIQSKHSSLLLYAYFLHWCRKRHYSNK